MFECLMFFRTVKTQFNFNKKLQILREMTQRIKSKENCKSSRLAKEKIAQILKEENVLKSSKVSQVVC